jgi:hypothetical protein
MNSRVARSCGKNSWRAGRDALSARHGQERRRSYVRPDGQDAVPLRRGIRATAGAVSAMSTLDSRAGRLPRLPRGRRCLCSVSAPCNSLPDLRSLVAKVSAKAADRLVGPPAAHWLEIPTERAALGYLHANCGTATTTMARSPCSKCRWPSASAKSPRAACCVQLSRYRASFESAAPLCALLLASRRRASSHCACARANRAGRCHRWVRRSRPRRHGTDRAEDRKSVHSSIQWPRGAFNPCSRKMFVRIAPWWWPLHSRMRENRRQPRPARRWRAAKQ